MGKLKEKLKGEVEKVYGSGVYDGLTKEQIVKRLTLGGEEETEIWTPFETLREAVNKE